MALPVRGRRGLCVSMVLMALALPLAACEHDPSPGNNPPKPISSAELRKRGCC